MRPGRRPFVFVWVILVVFGVVFAGCSRQVSGKASPDFAQLPRIAKEEQTARKYVNSMLNFDYHNLDALTTAMSTGISGDLAKTTGPDQLNALKQLFVSLEAVSTFEIVSSNVLEEDSDHAVVAVAGKQTLHLKDADGPRIVSTILKVTVQKADQTISALESLGQDSGGSAPSTAPSVPK